MATFNWGGDIEVGPRRQDSFLSSLCLKCRRLPSKPLAKTEYVHSLCFDDLLYSAQRCELCRLMLYGLRRSFAKSLSYSITLYENALDVHLATTSGDDRLIKITTNARKNLPTLNKVSSDHKHDSITVYIPMLVSCILDIGQVSGQVVFGVGQRREPDGSIVVRFYPKRILDLGGTNLIPDAPLRLCSDSPRFGRKYVTLSHRWGTQQHLTTTRENLEAHSSNIPFYSLPKTFQDAVVVTRLLDEWRQESLTMGEIYKNAVCTIATHTAHDDDQGFLSEISKGPLSARLQRQYHERELFVTLRSDFRAEVDRSQLSGRGWVLQERFLSPRTLHFTSRSMFWEDGFGVRSEEDQMPNSMQRADNQLAQYSWELQSTQSLAMPFFAAFTPLPGERLSICSRSATPVAYLNILQKYTAPRLIWQGGTKPFNYSAIERGTDKYMDTIDWLEIVERYSQCSLSHEEDKLPAISGMANHIQSRSPIPVHYCAGIWADRLHAGLLWVSGREHLHRSEINRAPSWSWASVDGEIQFPLGVEHITDGMELIKIYAQGFAYSSKDRSMTWFDGPGVLTMRTTVREIWIRDDAIVGVPPGLKRATRFRGMAYAPPTLPSRPTIWKYLNPDIGWVSPDTEDLPAKLWCAKVGSRFPSLQSIKPFPIIHAWVLLLIPTGNSPGEFKRCGMGAITEEGWFSNLPPTVITIV